MVMAVLDLDKLSAGYENGFVIHDISLSVEPGEFLAVLGRNGSGKSTLIRAVLNLLPNVTGRVLLNSRDVSALNRRETAQLAAYVPQLMEPVFQFSVWDIVLMGRYARQRRVESLTAEDKEAVEEALEVTHLIPLKERRLGHLSGGERQRVFLARALAQDTPLLLLDEPSLHLDISYQIEIYGLLKKLQKEKGKAVLAAEHNINLATPYSQNLMFLKDGKIFAHGPPEKLITKTIIQEVFQADVDIRENLHSGLPEISLIPKIREEP